MEVSGVFFRHFPCTSGVGIDAPSFNPSFPARPRVVSSVPAGHSISGEKLKINLGSSRPRMAFGVLDSGFADNGHLEYYRGVPRCGGEKEKNLGAMTTKKKLKLLKGLLSKDLSMFSELGSVSGTVDSIGLVGEVQEKAISDASEVLIEHLQKVREEEKKVKRNKKLEKAKMKASKMEDSSSSSSSSDSENEEVIDMTCLRSNILEQPKVNVLQSTPAATLTVSAPSTEVEKITKENGLEDGIVEVNQEKETSTNISTYSSSCSSISSSISVVDRSSSVTKSSFTKGIEVCMGNKCKNSGGAQLLEEFERVVGFEGAVVGCKCMGKCRYGPNVRILNCVDGTHSEVVDDSIRTPTNSICIGVGLEDVAVIVANFLGENPNEPEQFGHGTSILEKQSSF